MDERVTCIGKKRIAEMLYMNKVIGLIIEESNDAGETDWVIQPYWSILDSLPPVQIAGIDMSLRLKEYVRGYIPYFVEERTPCNRRKDLRKLLRAVGLTSNDRFEYMCRTGGLCGTSPITVRKKEVRYVDMNRNERIIDEEEELRKQQEMMGCRI